MRATIAFTVGLVCLAACTTSTAAPASTPPASSPVTASSTTPAGSTSASDTSTTPAATTNWPMYHGHPDHSGMSSSMPAASNTLHLTHSFDLGAAVYAAPIVWNGITVVATEADVVYGFDSSFHQLWKKDLGDPSPSQERPCGDIDPLGITGTPIYSPQTHLVYLVAEHNNPIGHEMFALSLTTGAVKWHKAIDLPGADRTVMQQRGALAISGGRVWAPFGALAGDCGNYKGRLVGMNLNGSGAPVKYDPSPNPQGGIWNPSGMSIDADGNMYPVSANGSTFPGDAYDHTNSVNEINPQGKRIDSFAPSDWAQNNQADVGLGSNGVALVDRTWRVVGGKSGPVYVLRKGHLGGIGGQVSMQNISPVYGGSAVNGSVVYLPTLAGIIAVRVDSKGVLHKLWTSNSRTTGSPVVGGGRVWAMAQSDGVLHALDPATGATKAYLQIGTTSRFTTPSIDGKYLLVGTLKGLAVVATS